MIGLYDLPAADALRSVYRQTSISSTHSAKPRLVVPAPVSDLLEPVLYLLALPATGDVTERGGADRRRER